VRGKAGAEAVAVFGQDTITLFDQYMNLRMEQAKLFNNDLPRMNKKRKKEGKRPYKPIEITDKSPLFTGVRDFEAQRRLTRRSTQNMIRETVVKAGLFTYEELEEEYDNRFNPFGFHAIRKVFSSIAEQYGMPYIQE